MPMHNVSLENDRWKKTGKKEKKRKEEVNDEKEKEAEEEEEEAEEKRGGCWDALRLALVAVSR